MNVKILMLLIAIAGNAVETYAQKEIPLYEGKIPNAKHHDSVKNVFVDAPAPYGRVYINVVTPHMALYLPPKEKNTGAAVIICPGGAYWAEVSGLEGVSAAKRFNEAGIAAMVLTYRLPNPDFVANKEYVPLQDAQQALILVRSNAKEWGIDPNRVGIMGSSAGGHLASTVGTHFQKCYAPNTKKISVRPDFMILNYPVISMADSLTNHGTRYSLIGPGLQPGDLALQRADPAKSEEKIRAAFVDKDKIQEFSNELHVTPDTPPTFIDHATDDSTVKVQNALFFIAALQQAGVKVQSFFYAKGGHGYGINNTTANVQWMDACIMWLQQNGWLNKKNLASK